jgi:replicative DNA helicase
MMSGFFVQPPPCHAPHEGGWTKNPFLDRHAAWEGHLREVANLGEVIVAKQRMGPIGVEKWSFNPELAWFTDL